MSEREEKREEITGVFVQVRLGSSRLPRKALLPLEDGAIIEHVMRACRLVRADHYALLTDAFSARAFESMARNQGFDVIVGPDDDVLARYEAAARLYGTSRVVRATGDNPLVSPSMADEILRIHTRAGADLSHFPGLPLGTGVEVIRAGALFEAAGEAYDPYEREHVTAYLYRDRDRFTVLEPECPGPYRFPDVKVSVDDRRDYALIKRIWRDLYRGEPIEIDDVARWLRRAAGGSERTSTHGEVPPGAGHETGYGHGSSAQVPRSRPVHE